MLDKILRQTAICQFDEKFDIWFLEVTIAQTFSSYIPFDCEGYALSDTFHRIEIELLVFKLCQVLFEQSFPKLSSDCSSEWKNELP